MSYFMVQKFYLLLKGNLGLKTLNQTFLSSDVLEEILYLKILNITQYPKAMFFIISREYTNLKVDR